MLGYTFTSQANKQIKPYSFFLILSKHKHLPCRKMNMGRPMPRGPAKNCPRRPDPIPYTEEQLRGMFWRYDKNKDGRLSKQELKDAFKNLGAVFPWLRTKIALHYADGNGDGYISDEEVDELVKHAVKRGYKVY